MERFHQSLKREAIRPRTPVDAQDARHVAGSYVDHYNNVRLHSAIGYIAPKDKLEGRAPALRSTPSTSSRPPVSGQPPWRRYPPRGARRGSGARL
ncbi:MAG: integrase core domain-containing protein [Candidatus Sumerlaeota bacterium]|nr:integrase core domain-containing protein [Candidatus Sumerlaeota bacterium]